MNILGAKAEEGVTSENIVAFTFTEKAAGELKDRIHTLCKEQLGSDYGLAEMYVGTIHGFCLDLLQTYQYRFLKYNILNDVQQRLLIDRHSSQSGLTDLSTHNGQQLRRWLDSRLYQKLLSIIREARIDEERLGDHAIRTAHAKYQELLDRKRYLDYSTILTEAVKALTTDDVLRTKISERVKYLIVDEYQDVNPLQEKLIELLHGLGAELCVVGDDDQAIYQWNGADIDNILGFRKRYPNVEQIPMGENFRSSPGIVRTGRRVVELNGRRLPKEMESQEIQEFAHGDLLCLEFSDPQHEAQWIVEQVKKLRGTPFSENGEVRGLSWSDFAILLRSVKNSAASILKALRAEGVPYIVKGMNGLFDTAEIQAACGIYYYLTREIDYEEMVRLWMVADLGIDEGKLHEAIAWLDIEKADWPNRWQKSTFAPQHTYKGFLSAVELREENIPEHGEDHRTRGELVYYNLGKFSQVISDFEEIHFHSDPDSFYTSLAGYLRHQAPSYYPEGWEDVGFARPDAVEVMTVHQAKGMEYPAVFVPNLVRNRFPAKRPGGRQWWHVIPKNAVIGADRYQGDKEDERRLFYVALTRSKKYLYCTWAPEAAKGLYAKGSDFVREYKSSDNVLTRQPAQADVEKIEPKPAKVDDEISLTFSELKYFYECPYQFKLRFLYGFNPGFHEKLGYGKSLHDALAEVHHRALDGEHLGPDVVPELLDTHLHLPYAWDKLKDDMRKQGKKVLERYLIENAEDLDKVEFAEKTIELKLADGIVVNGRIDLIRRTDTKQVIIIDFKSTERAQEDDITRQQLHIYALGYKQLTSESADLVEIYNLDEGSGATVRELVDEQMLKQTEENVVTAGNEIRHNHLCRVHTCPGCDFKGVCRSNGDTSA